MTTHTDLAAEHHVVFDVALNSYRQVDAILAADTAAAAGRELYDDAYFEKLFTAVQPLLERQMSAAITATAAAIISAWDQAGRPVVRLKDDRSPQRVRPR